MKPVIFLRNRIKCKLCGDIIESEHNYDFKYCKCGKTHIDGGHCCPRFGSSNLDNVETLFIVCDDINKLDISNTSDRLRLTYDGVLYEIPKVYEIDITYIMQTINMMLKNEY